MSPHDRSGAEDSAGPGDDGGPGRDLLHRHFPTVARATGALHRRGRSVLVVVVGLALVGVGVWQGPALAHRGLVLTTGPGLRAAHDAVLAADLADPVVEDRTLSACPWDALTLRCGWSEAAPEDAVGAFAAAVEAAGVAVGPVRCGVARETPWPGALTGWACEATVEGSRDRRHLVATAQVPGTDVPLGRTAVWGEWQVGAEVGDALGERVAGAFDEGTDPPATREQVLALVPERYRGLPCLGPADDACTDLEGSVPTDGLGGGDLVTAVTAELSAHGFFVGQAAHGPLRRSDADGTVLTATRLRTAGAASPTFVVVDVGDDGVVATVRGF